MKRRVVKKMEGLEVEVSGIRGKEEQLLEAFHACAAGKCGCPTQEYAKLETLEVEQGPGTITLRLKAKKGQQFDQGEIERCLEYTEEHIGQQE